ncbi:MAG: hypothetical protein J5I81_09990 [Nitrococcus mobilis]|nr:hypothetical protein [Nitrococcus mobilis]
MKLELAHSQRDTGGYAAMGQMADSRHPFRYQFTLIHATPEFTGYFRDQQFLSAGFNYSLHERWNLRGSFQFQRHNLNIDPERTAPQRWQTLFGTSYRLQGGTSLSLDYRHWENIDRRTVSSFDANHYSIRAGVGQQLGSLRLNANGEWGITADQANKDRFNTALYTALVGWQATQHQFYSAYLFYDYNMFNNIRQSAQSTLGVNANYRLFRSTLLDLNLQQNQSQGRDRYNLNLSLIRKLPKGQQLSLAVRQITGALAQTNVTIIYTIPFGLPVARKKGSATLQGRVFDVKTKAGIADVVLDLNGLIAVSGRDGYFKFPSVKEGIYYLGIERANTAFDKIALVDLPMKVQVQGGADNKIEIPLIQGGTLSGQIRRYEAKGLPSQNYAVRPVNGPVPEIGAKGTRQLVPTEGLPNILVFLSSGKRLHKRLTDDMGRFRLAGIPPGRWTVKVAEEGLPANRELDNQELTVDVKPGEETEVEFKVIPKVRKIKMLAPLKTLAR